MPTATRTRSRRAHVVPAHPQPAAYLGEAFRLSDLDTHRRFAEIVAEAYDRPRLFTYVDLFCGAGGSSIGLTMAGGRLLLAANHSKRNIVTHSTNFPAAEHLCADLNRYDMRCLPRGADVLWASPICTEVSPAGGSGAGKEFVADDDEPAYDNEVHVRTRATALDVIRATEVHKFPIVLVENVCEFATRWKLFQWWLDGMTILGYNYQIVCVSSAHVGGEHNPHAPQWRDRLYIVFTRNDLPLPDMALRPEAYCGTCDTDVEGIQTWKPRVRRVGRDGQPVGKYRDQYLFTCPQCRNQVEPYVRPAASIIDWSNLGERIGERKRPLAESTRRRIHRGLELFGPAALVNSNHDDDRAYPPGAAPMSTRTAKIGDGLAARPIVAAVAGNTFERPGSGYVRAWPAEASPLMARQCTQTDAVITPQPWLDANGGSWNADPASVADPFRTRTTRDWEALVTPGAFVDAQRNNGRLTPAHDPMTTVAAGGNHHGLVTTPPFYVKLYGNAQEARYRAKPVTDPFGAMTASNSHGLVVPYYRTGRAASTGDPLHTITVRDRFGLVAGLTDDDVDACFYRMIQPGEQALAQRFPISYEITGNKTEQTAQAGNAVSTNVAQWIAERATAVLHRTVTR